MLGTGRAWGVAALIGALLVPLVAPDARAAGGVIGTVIEAPDASALSIAVSRHSFAYGVVADVVVAPAGQPDILALAASFTGSTPLGAPLLLTGDGGAGAVLTEAGRVTGGPSGSAGAEPPTIWVIGRDDPGFVAAGYEDVRVFTGTVAAVADAVLAAWPGGSKSRVVLVESGNPAAGALGAAFGAANGVPAIPLGSAPSRLTGNHIDRAIAIGKVNAPSGLPVATTVNVGDPSALSALVATRLFKNEVAEGFGDNRPVQAVIADGYGSDLTASFLAATVSARSQDAGGSGPLALVEGRPEDGAASVCEGDATDSEAHCVIASSVRPAVLVTLTGTGAVVGGAVTRIGDALTIDRLPATGGGMSPLLPLVLGCVVVVAARAVRTRRRCA
jgi:hypothetical protein